MHMHQKYQAIWKQSYMSSKSRIIIYMMWTNSTQVSGQSALQNTQYKSALIKAEVAYLHACMDAVLIRPEQDIQ